MTTDATFFASVDSADSTELAFLITDSEPSTLSATTEVSESDEDGSILIVWSEASSPFTLTLDSMLRLGDVLMVSSLSGLVVSLITSSNEVLLLSSSFQDASSSPAVKNHQNYELEFERVKLLNRAVFWMG